MSVSLLTPDWGRSLAGLVRRVSILERRVSTGSGGTVDTSYEITWSFAGTITATEAPPKRVWKGGSLTVLAVTMKTAGSTATVLTVARNGTVVATITVPSGTTTFNGEVSARFAPDDIMTLTVTTAGTGAANMTADARFAA